MTGPLHLALLRTSVSAFDASTWRRRAGLDGAERGRGTIDLVLQGHESQKVSVQRLKKNRARSHQSHLGARHRTYLWHLWTLSRRARHRSQHDRLHGLGPRALDRLAVQGPEGQRDRLESQTSGAARTTTAMSLSNLVGTDPVQQAGWRVVVRSREIDIFCNRSVLYVLYCVELDLLLLQSCSFSRAVCTVCTNPGKTTIFRTRYQV
jgi:hypothetical protein